MDFAHIPVFGQSVKPGLGLRFRGNYWAFFDKRTELSPWLILHRESVNDTELDELLLHGFPRTRTGDTVDCKVLTHFGLIQGDLYEDGWTVGRTERQRTAAFTGDVLVVKIPLSANPQKDLLDPESIYWSSQTKLVQHAAGSPEHERGKALVEMASILLARWREHDTQNLDFKIKNRIQELWEEGKAVASGAGAAAMGFVQGLWDLIKVTVEFGQTVFKASCHGVETIIASNFSQIKTMLLDAGMAAYNTAQEMTAAVKEGLRLLERIGSDRLLRTGLFEFLDGYGESVPHLRRLHNASTVVFTIGIEVLLAIATMGGSLAVGAARIVARAAQAASHVGPFTMKAIGHLARFAKAMDKAQAPKMRSVDSATAAKPAGGGGKPGSTGGAGNGAGNKNATPKAADNNSQGASCTKVSCTETAGEPISMFNGEELLQLLDCTLPGLIGLNWQRTYRSSLAEKGFDTGLGKGWSHPLGQHLEVNADSLNYIDDEGRAVYFKPLAIGQRCNNLSEFLTLVRTGDHTYRLQANNGLGVSWFFEQLRDDSLHSKQPGKCALVRMEDAFGNTLRIEYTAGRATHVHSSQSTWVIGYNEQGLVYQIAQLAADESGTSEDNPIGVNQLVLVQYRYNEQGQLTGAMDAAGFEEQYAYNADNVLVQRTLKSGYNIYFEWQRVAGDGTAWPNARCVRQWGDPVDGQPTYHYRFEWEVNGCANHSASIDSRGARTDYQFNDQGLPTWVRGPEGGTTRTRYNSNGQVLERTDPQGFGEQFQYNSKGHLVAYTNKLAQLHEFELNAQGQVLKHTAPANPDGKHPVRTNTYTPEGLLASHTDATGATTRYRYNSLGLLCETISPLGQSSRILYNAQGQVQAQTNALGQSKTVQFDTWGRLASVTNPLGRTAWYAYDLMGRCTRASNQEGLTTQYSYGPLGQLESITDPTGRSTVYEYADRLSQPTARIDPMGNRLRYRYDSERNLIELQNENGQSCHFDYDLAERLIKESGFDGRVQTYQYNAAGHLLEKQEWGVLHGQLGGGQQSTLLDLDQIPAQPLAYTRYKRDAHGKLLKATHSDGEETSYGYNTQGQLIQATNAHRQLAWEVDLEGRVQAELQNQHRIEHQYNLGGWLKQTHWQAMGAGAPEGTLAYQYNALGLVSEINLNGMLLAQFERDMQGRELVRKLSNQVHTQSLYDPQGRLVGQVNRQVNRQVSRREFSAAGSSEKNTISRRRYCYNPRNQLVRIDDQGHGTHLYHYDVLDRLRTAEGPTPEAFLFDPASNLLETLDGQEATDALASKALPEPTSPNAHRPQQAPGNRLKRQGNRRFNYDARGNRIEEIIERGPRQGQVTRYRYNAQNQLVEVNVGGVITRYAYDALGRRISKSSEQGNTTFYWNGDVLLGEVNSGSSAASAAASPGTAPSRTYLFEPFSFKPLALVQGAQVYHYHTDHIGTPREITNAQAEVVWASTFKTYGALALAHVNEVENPLRFQGQYYDCESGLHYNRHRYYDPNCGQFTTQDPIGLLGGMNAYQYAPNPVTWVDPWGLSCKESFGGLSPDEQRRIAAIPKDARPNPEEYLTESYIKNHLQHFDDGASRFMTQQNLSKYGVGQRDGTAFVMPRAEADKLLQATGGDARKMESALGLPADFLKGNQLVRVDIPNPKDLGLRIPSGNEAGANPLWIPGGKLPDGTLEAVIDVKNATSNSFVISPLNF